MKLNPMAFGLACGILWALAVFLWTWVVILMGGSDYELFALLGKIYLGYSATPLGSVVGLVYGFVDGLIGGWIFAWVYNRLLPAA